MYLAGTWHSWASCRESSADALSTTKMAGLGGSASSHCLNRLPEFQLTITTSDCTAAILLLWQRNQGTDTEFLGASTSEFGLLNEHLCFWIRSCIVLHRAF